MSQSTPSCRVYVSLAVITMAMLMFEIVMTRIFSVTLWYHYAFMAISLAMFGMTIGALCVFLLPDQFPANKAAIQMGWSALGFALTVPLGIYTHLAAPLGVSKSFIIMAHGIVLNYIALAAPFVFSGICVTLALTRFPKKVGAIYAADLIGSSFGCVGALAALGFMDALSAVHLTGALAAMASGILLSGGASTRKGAKLAWIAGCVLLSLSLWNGLVRQDAYKLFALSWIKGAPAEKPMTEKWNAFSRISVEKCLSARPYGWGLSQKWQSDSRHPAQYLLSIDAGAITPITQFTGNPEDVDFLRYDVSNIAHELKSDSNVFVVGAGGGRDVVSALIYNQRSIVAVEINNLILDTLLKDYGDFAGNLDRYLNVRFICDEARSFITRYCEPIDILQISLIDTWAATSAGAYVLTENSLYTKEAWHLFLDKLSDKGILSVSRWYGEDYRSEMYRTVSLACSVLTERGVQNPRAHLIMVSAVNRDPRTGERFHAQDIATLLICKEPFARSDLDAVAKVSSQRGFDLILTPEIGKDEGLERLTDPAMAKAFIRDYPFQLSPPTDDSPFFFNMGRLRSLIAIGSKKSEVTANTQAVTMLVLLFFLVSILSVSFILWPLKRLADHRGVSAAKPLFVYFCSIGLGFMLIEIALMQRLNLFLGHPIYGLSVVLFSLLLSCGIGSYLTEFCKESTLRKAALGRLGMLLALLTLMGFGLQPLLHTSVGFQTWMRILISIAALFPAGLLMGAAFPLGMMLANRSNAQHLTPWFWGLNGAMSVVSSVLAVMLSVLISITAAFWTGTACYLLATVMFAVHDARHPNGIHPTIKKGET